MFEGGGLGFVYTWYFVGSTRVGDLRWDEMTLGEVVVFFVP